MFDKLDKHTIIGWDFDNTLFEHPKAPLFYEYINRTPEKIHYIITHRSHGWQDDVWDDLRQYTNLIGREDFADLLNVPDKVYEEFRDMRASGSEYVEWKGRVCRKIGATILIDDNFPHNLPGCQKYGIELIHPDDFSIDGK